MEVVDCLPGSYVLYPVPLLSRVALVAPDVGLEICDVVAQLSVGSDHIRVEVDDGVSFHLKLGAQTLTLVAIVGKPGGRELLH